MAKQQAPKVAPSAEEQAAAPYSVIKPFRDINNWDLEHKAGDDVSHFDQDRLDSLVERGLIQPPFTEDSGAGDENPD
ncbi:hypothetical protein DYBT9623_04415 [Dyadobacter sp. CECT 9623]|uniref:Uncharacterized protein n=1 Tax=Dyadobacter linearis TaxID=2823330 RepID=A0ABM8UVP9_9BACT|nr:hypothetical protein [Dyadobacter sp. CECT 9623]CAG5072875.1 hypothetical protein DYBT9623_04415 [Dyadobacter sp. CECT 9623]